MTESSPSLVAPENLDLRAARALIAKELGPQKLAELHRPNLVLDVGAMLVCVALFLGLAFELGTGSIRDLSWWLCLVIQGNLILILAYQNHDAFVHRKLFAPRLRWVLSAILVWPSQLRASVYEEKHLLHHRALGTGDDSELYKHSINTRLRRFLYATAAMIFYRAIFLRGGTASVSVSPPSEGAGRTPSARGRIERTVWLLLLALAAVTAFIDYRFVVYGYLLPYALVTPVLNSMRIILEHFDLARGNPLWTGTFYRTGLLSRVMFWWDAGDCHLVHHFYANIPFYRMGQALRLIRPILIEHGVYEHRSLVQLVRQWFVGARAHWSMPPQAHRPVGARGLAPTAAGEPR